MAELFRNDWWIIFHDQGQPFVRLVRTGTPFSDLADANRAIAELVTPLRPFNRLLLDFRGGPPGRNDSEFEDASVGFRKLMARSFEKRAVVVKSAAGKLQMKRLNDSGEGFLVTQVEAEAIRFLT